MNHLEALLASLLDLLHVSYTHVGLSTGTMFLTGLFALVALLGLTVMCARIDDINKVIRPYMVKSGTKAAEDYANANANAR
ncbi:MAG: hypothetical protein JWO07_731 [Candidatus Saccharibacteria bacterium]|nr:hypothetical protein [Candidatus Saccharibacteria bacterium]